MMFVVLSLASPPATAHALLTASEPTPGSRLEVAPSRVVLRFTSLLDASGSSFDVLDQNATRVNEGRVLVSNDGEPHMTSTLKSGLGDGAYLIRWRAVSALDGHQTSGSLGFAVGAFEPPTAVSPNPQTVAAGIRQTLLHGAVYVGLSLALGALMFWFRVDPGRDLYRWPLVVGALLQAIGSAGIAAAVRPPGQPWGEFLSGPAGIWYATRVVAGMVVAVALVRPRRGAYPLALAAMVFALWGEARTSHIANYGILGTVLDWFHLAAGTTLVGGMGFLLTVAVLAVRRKRPVSELSAVARRWTKVALGMILLVSATGLILEMGLLGPKRTLDPVIGSGSAYGGFVVGKTILLGAIILAALANHFFYGFGSDEGWTFRPRTLNSIVLFQTLAGLVIVSFTATMVPGGPPPMTNPGAAQDPTGLALLDLEGRSQSFQASFTIDPRPLPGASSTVRFSIIETDGGRPLADDTCGRTGCLGLSLTHLGDNESNPDLRVARPTGNGRWTSDPYLFVLPGEYRLTLMIQTEYVYGESIDVAFRVVP